MARRACLWVPGKLPAWASLFVTERPKTDASPQQALPAVPTTKRHEPAKLVVDRKPKRSRRHKARKHRRVVFVVTDFATNQGSSTVVDLTPNNKPSDAERRRFLKRLGVA